MEQDTLLLTQHESVATITLNRPQKRNAFDDKIILQFIDFLQQLAGNDAIRAIVIRGNGDHFCAGADIHWMQKAAQYSYDLNHRDALKLAQLMQLLYEIKKPTIAVIQGSVYGGGIGLVACSDIVIAASNTKFCFSEVKMGIVPAVIGPYIECAIGQRAALRYILTAEIFDAQKAHEFGLVHEVVEEDKKEAILADLLQKLKANGPIAIQRSKEMLHYFSQERRSASDYVAYTTDLIARMRASNEAKEGFSAFLDKRIPLWQMDHST